MEYAIVTFEFADFGRINIRVSRRLPVKIIINQLFIALERSQSAIQSYCLRAMTSQKFLFQTDTLQSANIYDGEVLRIV